MNTKNLYLISFIEGGAVMVTEIAGAKLLSPFFGASIYSWASTLSITLLALMCGYYSGGYLTTKPKYQSANKIVWVFLLCGLFVMLMPPLADFIMTQTISFSFFSGLIISQLVFLFIPIFLMALISPMIIFQITKKAEESGQLSGSIYALSTSGGIVFTLLFGFFIIPEYGISAPVKMLGACISLLGIVLLVTGKPTRKDMLMFIGVILVASVILFQQQNLPSLKKLSVLDRSEGLLGELKVVDQVGQAPDGSPMIMRTLRTNNVTQNCVLAKNPSQSLLYYVNFTKQLLSEFPQKNSALLVGLGAGSLYKIMTEQYKSVTSIELDKRIYDYGVQYFGMAAHDNVVDDGRHYINTCQEKFDLIMIDVIVGENIPGQMISEESFKKCSDMLTDNGMLVIENGAVYNFSRNSFAPSIAKTLEAAGFRVAVFNPLLSLDHGDVVFVASKRDFDYDHIVMKNELMIKGGPISNYTVPANAFDIEHAKVLTDDRNYTDKQLKEYYLTVREAVRSLLAKEIIYVKHSGMRG